MPLVQVVHAGIEPKFLQQTRAADSQHHLLHQTRFAIAAVQMSRNQPVSRFILSDIGIQKIKLYATHVGPPHTRAHNSLAHGDFNQQRLSFRVVYAVQSQLV